MPVVKVYISHDKEYRDAMKEETILVNRLDYYNPVHRDIIQNALKQTITSDVISMVPTCMCGELSKMYNNGKLCDQCGTRVRERITSFEPILWLETPIDDLTWISPAFLARFLRLTDGDSKSMIRWFGDKRYNPPVSKKVVQIKAMYKEVEAIEGFERSYRWFQNHIEDVIKAVIIASNDANRNRELMLLLKAYKANKRNIHSRLMPILNRRFVIVEASAKGKFINKDTIKVSEIVMMFLSAISGEIKVDNIERAMVQNMTMNAKLYANIKARILGTKRGISRKQLYGARSPFTCRNVISPMVGKHDYNEVLLPWGSAVTMMRPYLINYLLRKGYMYTDITLRLNRIVNKYDKEIDGIFKEMILSSRYGCIWLSVQRNPSQGPYAALTLPCKAIKTDPTDTTFSISAQIVGFPNGDFDGDEENISLLPDEVMISAFMALEPHVNVPGNSPAEIFGKVGLPKPVSITISNRIRVERKLFKPIE